jgi:hypothetical protein
MKKFFRVIWRINALIICVAGILLVGLLVFGIAESVIASRNFGAAGSVPVSSGTAAKQNAKLTVSKVESLDGMTIVRATVQFGSSGDGGSFSSSGYIPAATNAIRTLFPANNCVIVQSDDLYFPAEPCDKRVMKWTDFIFADKDTNNDGVISEKDLQTLAVASPDGQNYHVYLTGLDRVLSTQLIGENDFYAYYMQGENLFVARIDLQLQKIVQTTKLF